jgi:hypothetical protein
MMVIIIFHFGLFKKNILWKDMNILVFFQVSSMEDNLSASTRNYTHYIHSEMVNMSVSCQECSKITNPLSANPLPRTYEVNIDGSFILANESTPT